MLHLHTPAASPSSPALADPSAILHLQAGDGAELREAVRKGLPFSAFEALSRHLAISQQQVTAVLGIPPRTIARRKASQSLTPQESDRLYRVAKTIAQTVEVLGSIDKARVWLKSPNRALGGEVPLDLLDTEIGAHQVEDVLLRLNYGIFS
ncbi:type II RES/Xre toxin-antitoxin system antitoxin [Synechococcus sp. BA-132 BA5]|uniref:type II RES/Xre toxin-antitoxin system antitoxin n=1 Tax=Synechococcus sp. BA-132 BA5 TaxID=3110252 RepID=UPI002B21DB2C|nr:antitoxin Xre/MbcA/ParS toxin-binding domain-containing protein [Synechococcus sp. BA-132 BA5]MEA5417442.1 antitoxin Xre/MbcA/ParS toxin-binding domain-containing protein [Synechococcus sp. BA-132 BA5]